MCDVRVMAGVTFVVYSTTALYYSCFPMDELFSSVNLDLSKGSKSLNSSTQPQVLFVLDPCSTADTPALDLAPHLIV